MGIDHDAIELIGIEKSFGAVKALRGIDWGIRRGEVHALLGENGAGKSTLCSILAGSYRPDAGRIRIDGQERSFKSPRDGLAAGIGMVYQEFRLVRSLTVAENLALASTASNILVRRRSMERDAGLLAEQFGMDIRPAARVGDLSMGEQQRVEILKLLIRDTSVLMLDEPTSVLTPQESAALFATVRALAETGRCIVLVSHKLDEVCEVSDRITVLRDGERVGQVHPHEIRPRELARLMVGREVHPANRPAKSTDGAPALAVDGLRVSNDSGREVIRGVDLILKRHEILGIAGVSGNGQREFAEALAGIREVSGGTIHLGPNRVEITRTSVRARSDLGMAYIPDDRLGTGVAPRLAAWINLSLRNIWRTGFSRGPWVRSKVLRSNAQRLVDEFQIRGVTLDGPVQRLSGGNVQRVILARELEAEPKVVIAAAPTRGLDVSAVVAIHQLLFQQSAAGAGVLLISEDLDELLMVSDRIVVMYQGRIVGECKPGQVDLETIGAWMAGHSLDDEMRVPEVPEVEHGAAALGLVVGEAD